jgi:large subunit ribosomal protein L23
VEVTGVQVMNVKGKVKKNRYGMARQKDWKKAYVSIKPGQEIDLAAA